MARKERQLHMQMYPGWSSRQNYSQGKKKKRNRDKTQDGGTHLPHTKPFLLSNSGPVAGGARCRGGAAPLGTDTRPDTMAQPSIMVLNLLISFTLNLFIIVNFT